MEFKALFFFPEIYVTLLLKSGVSNGHSETIPAIS